MLRVTATGGTALARSGSLSNAVILIRGTRHRPLFVRSTTDTSYVVELPRPRDACDPALPSVTHHGIHLDQDDWPAWAQDLVRLIQPKEHTTHAH